MSWSGGERAARAATVAVCLGTRPEAIKLAPVVRALQASPDTEPLTLVSGQHREMLEPALAAFGVVADVDLALMRPNQDLAELTGSAVAEFGKVLRRLKPDAVVVQGDTT